VKTRERPTREKRVAKERKELRNGSREKLLRRILVGLILASSQMIRFTE